MAGPLAGVRVLEVANWIAVPGAGALLADLGAEVIKLEPPRGDTMRGLMRKPQLEGARGEFDAAFQLDNRGKRSVAVDLESPQGREVVQRLLSQADVFTTNLVPQRMQRYGLDPESVHALAPRVVHVSLSAFGHRGEEADRTGYDMTAYFARSGATDLLASAEELPDWGAGQGDHVTAMNLLAAILVGLRARDQSGRGQVVQTSLLQTGAYSLASDYQIALLDGRQPPRVPLAERNNALHRAWRVKGGRWVLLMMLNPKPYWPGFCRAIDRPEWATDPRFARFADRLQNRAELYPMIQEILESRPLEEWAERFDQNGLLWAPVQQLREAVRDPQLRANGIFSEIEHPEHGRFETLSAPFSVQGADVAVRGPAPELGEHTQWVLQSAGLTPEEIEDLTRSGAVGARPKR